MTSHMLVDFSRIANNKQHQDEHCLCFAGMYCLELLVTGSTLPGFEDDTREDYWPLWDALKSDIAPILKWSGITVAAILRMQTLGK